MASGFLLRFHDVLPYCCFFGLDFCIIFAHHLATVRTGSCYVYSGYVWLECSFEHLAVCGLGLLVLSVKEGIRALGSEVPSMTIKFLRLYRE